MVILQLSNVESLLVNHSVGTIIKEHLFVGSHAWNERDLSSMFIVQYVHIFFSKTLAPDTGWNYHYEALNLYNGAVFWSLTLWTSILLTRWSRSQLHRLKQPPSSTRGCCWTSEKYHPSEKKVGSGEWGGRQGAGGGVVEKKSWMQSWHFCLRWGMLCWCHTWNVSEVSVINTSIRNLHIPQLYLSYPKETHTKT